MNSAEGHTKTLSGDTLKKPVKNVKKRSGPLDEAIDLITSDRQQVKDEHSEDNSCASGSKDKLSISTSNYKENPSYIPRRKLSYLKEKDKKRERWLLTRKTWKYMTDAGRKLIPDSVQDRKEDVLKVDAHFQEVCAAEPRFVLWRRKTSYPGGVRNSKRRWRQLLQHTGYRSSQPQNVEQIENEYRIKIDHTIHLLQSHLDLEGSRKVTALLGSNTVRPDQTSSPSAQRPNDRTSGSFVLQDPLQKLSEIDQLLERLKDLQRSATAPIVDIPLEKITSDILKDKVLLKQIYSALKKQQLHCMLSKHSKPTRLGRGRSTYSLSLSSLNNLNQNNNQKYNADLRQSEAVKHKSNIANRSTRRSPPKSVNLLKISSPLHTQIKKSYNSCGVQTKFIQLKEIKILCQEYEERKRQEILLRSDKETEKSKDYQIFRKSSIDNEDVSQSVSDTIKRYLRMARKKSTHDGDANRFKRVNYDRNLRNIHAKGEINPPGIDEGNSKAVQTLDAWPLIALKFIHGNETSAILEEAHCEWQKDLDERIRRKTEYEKKIEELRDKHDLTKSLPSSCSTSSAPNSPTSPVLSDKSFPRTGTEDEHSHSNFVTGSIIHSSTQFFSNLWHGYQKDETSMKKYVGKKSYESRNIFLKHRPGFQKFDDVYNSLYTLPKENDLVIDRRNSSKGMKFYFGFYELVQAFGLISSCVIL